MQTNQWAIWHHLYSTENSKMLKDFFFPVQQVKCYLLLLTMYYI